MKRVVFVCSGNICRSPMAAGMANTIFAEKGIPAAVISCGTLNIAHEHAARHAIAALQEIGIDISSHRSQGVSLGLVRLGDAVVVMAPNHEAYLNKLAPGLPIVRMWEYFDSPLAEIEDPVGKDLDAFRACRDILEVCLRRWVDSLTETS